MSWLSDNLGFEKSNLGTMWDNIKSNPLRLLYGSADPLSTKVWNGILGTNDKPIVDQWGGPTPQAFSNAQAQGINTGPASQVHDTAHVIAALEAAGYGAGQLGALGGAAESGAPALGNAGAASELGAINTAGSSGLAGSVGDAGMSGFGSSIGQGLLSGASGAMGGSVGQAASGATSASPSWLSMGGNLMKSFGSGMKNSGGGYQMQPIYNPYGDMQNQQQVGQAQPYSPIASAPPKYKSPYSIGLMGYGYGNQ